MIERKINLCLVMLLLALAGFSTAAKANQYNYSFTFTETDGFGSSAASGQLEIVSGRAIDGYLDLTAGPAQGEYSLYTWNTGGISSVRVSGGTDLIVDNLVNIGANPFLDVYGLAFVTADHAEGIDLSLASGQTYNLGGYGAVGYAVPNANGQVILTGSVPDAASTLALLGFSLVAIIGIQRLQLCLPAGTGDNSIMPGGD